MISFNRLWTKKCCKRSIIYKGRKTIMEKIKKRIANLKVAGKLKVYRMTVLVMTLFLVLVALISTLVIRLNIEKITEVWSPSLEYLQDLETMTAKYRIKQYQHLVESDAAVMNSCEEEIQKLESQIEDTGAKLDAIISADSKAQKGRDDYDVANAAWEKYRAASDEILNNYGGALYGANPGSIDEARQNFQKLFIQSTPVDEVLLSRGYVDGSTNNNRSGHGWSLYYSLAQVNPGALRYGRFSPTLDLVDLFEDYTDDGTGKSAPIKTRADGNEANVPNVQLEGNVKSTDPYIQYSSLSEPFLNKDARLQASVIIPGSSYASVPILMQGGLVETSGKVVVYNNSSAQGKDGKTYFAFGAEGTSGYSGFGNIGNSENGNYTTTGFSVRKYMEEEKFSSLSSRDNSITTPFIDIRLAEIYLNYAEAVVESGKGDQNKAATLLNALRHRAAHKDNIPLTLENVLKERRVELAFEGKRFWDMVRRRDNHVYYNGGMRSALVPMIDLRTDTPSYIFVRANFHGDEKQNGRTFAPQSYYRAIPGTASNGLVQNPGY